MIGTRIKKLRKEKNLSQVEFSKMIGLNQSTVANYEKDIRIPSVDLLIKMAKLFDTSVDYLIGFTDVRKHNLLIDDMDIIQLSDLFLNLLLDKKDHEALILAEKYLNNNNLEDLYYKLFRMALTKLGWLWEVQAVHISDEHEISHKIENMISYFSQNNKNKHSKTTDEIQIIGMSAPGEMHNFGLKMTMALLEQRGYVCHYIGDAVPVEDFNLFINEFDNPVLLISITSEFHQDNLLRFLSRIGDLPIVISGLGTNQLRIDKQKILGVFKTYKMCLAFFKENTFSQNQTV